MNIKTVELAGIHSAIHAMRNPMDSWDRSDTVPGKVGDKDRELSMKLAHAGTEHSKHLRMVVVWADITAPRYWWTEFDTYRAGVEKVSCSTMHTLMRRPLEEKDFECGCASPIALEKTIEFINSDMELYKNMVDPEAKEVVWRGIIQLLPQSFLQKRTVMMSYAALRNIYRQREGHKLKEWEYFREWVRKLPESWMITDEIVEVKEEDDE